jgi:hypothetical protein
MLLEILIIQLKTNKTILQNKYRSMAKNPAFPFYAQDYLVDTLRWSREAKSLQVDLLCESWANGALVDNNGAPDGLNDEDLKIWQKIKHKWAL